MESEPVGGDFFWLGVQILAEKQHNSFSGKIVSSHPVTHMATAQGCRFNSLKFLKYYWPGDLIFYHV